MRDQEIQSILRERRPSRPNPFATEAAAEELERQGKRAAAHAVRQEIEADDNPYALDPLEILLRAERESDSANLK